MHNPFPPRPGFAPRPSTPQQPAAETAASAASEQATRSASSEQLFEQGDPSLAKKNSTQQTGANTPGKRQVKWMRPTDLAMQGAALTLKGGSLGHLRMHQWMRKQAARGMRATGHGARRLPEITIGRRGPAQESPQQTPRMS